MAQLKPEYQPPSKRMNFLERLRQKQEEFDRTHPILDTRYFVEEWRREYTHWSDDTYTPAQLVRTYGPFTKAEYDEWMRKHEPNAGSGDSYDKYEFKTRVEHLRHYSYDKWGR